MQSYLHRLSVFVWSDENDSNTLRVNTFFFKTEEKISVFKNNWIRVDEAKHSRGPVYKEGGNPSARVTVKFACKPELALTLLLG